MADTMDGFLTVDGAAERAGCSIQTIRYRMATGKLVPTKRVIGPAGKPLLLLFHPDDVDRHFEDHPLPVDNRRRGYA